MGETGTDRDRRGETNALPATVAVLGCDESDCVPASSSFDAVSRLGIMWRSRGVVAAVGGILRCVACVCVAAGRPMCCDEDESGAEGLVVERGFVRFGVGARCVVAVVAGAGRGQGRATAEAARA